MEVDKAVRGEISMEETNGRDDRREFQALVSLSLITIRASEVALIGQVKG
jgi:hypothetical protein